MGDIDDVLADRILVGKVPGRHGLVDDGDGRLGFVLPFCEVAAADQACAGGGEVGRAHLALGRLLVSTAVRPAYDAKPGGVAVVRDRQLAGDADGLDAGQNGDAA